MITKYGIIRITVATGLHNQELKYLQIEVVQHPIAINTLKCTETSTSASHCVLY